MTTEFTAVALPASTHTIFIKPHGAKLQVVNLPVWMSEQGVRDLFTKVGKCVRVEWAEDEIAEQDDWSDEEDEDESMDPLDAPATATASGSNNPKRVKKPVIHPLPAVPSLPHTTGSTAWLYFTTSLPENYSSQSLNAALPRKSPAIDFLARHKALRPPAEEIKLWADSHVARFDWDARQKSSVKTERQIEMESGGFTMVASNTTFGRSGKGKDSVAVFRPKLAGLTEQDSNMGKKRKKKSLGAMPNEELYTYQRREKKRQELVDLRLKFQEDKKKVDLIMQRKEHGAARKKARTTG